MSNFVKTMTIRALALVKSFSKSQKRLALKSYSQPDSKIFEISKGTIFANSDFSSKFLDLEFLGSTRIEPPFESILSHTV